MDKVKKKSAKQRCQICGSYEHLVNGLCRRCEWNELMNVQATIEWMRRIPKMQMLETWK